MPLFGWKMNFVICLGLLLFSRLSTARPPNDATQKWKQSLLAAMESNLDQVSQPAIRNYHQMSKHRDYRKKTDPSPKRKPLVVELRSRSSGTKQIATPTQRKRITGHQMKVVGAQYHWKCAMCSKQLGSDFHVDHIIPLHLHGPRVVSNFQPLCPGCHAKKIARNKCASNSRW